jgi:short-subunit dehydrogenase
MATALITGGTAGIGAAFAEQLASEGYELIIVARSKDRLESEASRLAEKYQMQVHAIAADLETVEGRALVKTQLQNENRPIDLLVNNAGFGLRGRFHKLDVAELKGQYDVNMTAVMEFTHAVLPSMVARNSGAIINVSSIAAYYPGIGGHYAATKSYVSAFSESIQLSLSGTGVKVMALCPGFTRSEFHERAKEAVKLPKFLWLTADRVAADALADLRKGKTVSIPSTIYKILAAISPLVPKKFVVRRLAKSARK